MAKKPTEILGTTSTGKVVYKPVTKSPNMDNIDVYRKIQARYPGWTKADHAEAEKILTDAGLRGWAYVHWDLGRFTNA